MNGQEWVRYDCSWNGPETGQASDLPNFNPLADPDGINSGEWLVVMSLDGRELMRATLTVEGTFQNWTPVGVLPYCIGLTNK